MSGGYLPQSSSGFRGMSVPETIQLTTDRGDALSSQKPNQYRQMQVPDKITIDDTRSTVTPPTSEEVRQEKDRVEPVVTTVKKEEHVVTQPRYLHRGVESVEHSYNEDNATLRLSLLEDRVNKLEAIVNRGGVYGHSNVLSRFWYVVTFSAWMMLPLSVVYMFYYRRNS